MRWITSFLFLFLSINGFCHQDFYVTKEKGNVVTRIKTGYNYFEIEKVELIGEIVFKLCQKLNYKKKILLDFQHHYTGECDSDFFISFEKGNIEKITNSNYKISSPLKRNGIVIRQISQNFEIDNTLKLVEFAIRNRDRIKKSQNKITYKRNFCNWRINTVDTSEINYVINNYSSHIITEILSEKSYLKKPTKWGHGTNYYYQNGAFHFSVRLPYANKDSVVLSISNIYQIENIRYDYFPGSKLIFDTDSTFYQVGLIWENDSNTVLSNRQKIKKERKSFRPFQIEQINKEEVLIKRKRTRLITIKEINEGVYKEYEEIIYYIYDDRLVKKE